MLTILFSILFANDVIVFDVRKSLSLHEEQPVYHDYYINAGAKNGLKNKMLITVTRRSPFKETNLSKIDELMNIDLAEIELIHVQNTFSIGRLKRLLPAPILEFQSIMIGDRIDLKKGRMPASEETLAVEAAGESPVAPVQEVQAKSEQKIEAVKAVETKANVKEEAKKYVPSAPKIQPNQDPVPLFGEGPTDTKSL